MIRRRRVCDLAECVSIELTETRRAVVESIWEGESWKSNEGQSG